MRAWARSPCWGSCSAPSRPRLSSITGRERLRRVVSACSCPRPATLWRGLATLRGPPLAAHVGGCIVSPGDPAALLGVAGAPNRCRASSAGGVDGDVPPAVPAVAGVRGRGLDGPATQRYLAVHLLHGYLGEDLRWGDGDCAGAGPAHPQGPPSGLMCGIVRRPPPRGLARDSPPPLAAAESPDVSVGALLGDDGAREQRGVHVRGLVLPGPRAGAGHSLPGRALGV